MFWQLVQTLVKPIKEYIIDQVLQNHRGIEATIKLHVYAVPVDKPHPQFGSSIWGGKDQTSCVW